MGQVTVPRPRGARRGVAVLGFTAAPVEDQALDAQPGSAGLGEPVEGGSS
jgi:hypothetical protein